MSLLSNIFERQPIEVQKRNGFDLSHLVCGTSKCGQLVPVLTRLMMPASKWTLGASVQCELPPLATSFFGRVDFVLEAFYTPCSALYGGWRQFISNELASSFPASQNPLLGSTYFSGDGYVLPLIDYSSSQVFNVETALAAENNSILRYMGYSDSGDVTAAGGRLRFNMLPFLCYHRICDVYYRNPQVTQTWFAVNPNSSFDGDSAGFNTKNVSLVWHSFYTSLTELGEDSSYSYYSGLFDTTAALRFPDSVSIFSTRQRPWARDYFTAASVDPQQGNPSTLAFGVTVNDDAGVGEFTIASLRAANSLQKFLEANNYGYNYRDSMLAQFGEYPSDNLHDEPVYLGRLVIPVYQKGIYLTSQTTPIGSSNPWGDDGVLGTKGASGSFTGEGSLVKSFHNKEFGYLMVLASLVPHTMYNYGCSRDLLRNSIGDFPFPLLQGVGMDSIKDMEVYAANGALSTDFAYIPRYSFEKYICDRACGELVPGKTLSSFVLQRSFSGMPEFGTEFLEIPQDALDDVFAVTTNTSKLSCWWEIFFSFKVSMPLAEFSIPSLGDLRDTKTIYTKQGGSRL